MTSKQISLHPARSLWSQARLLLLLCLSCIGADHAPAQSPAASVAAANLRLLAAPRLLHGTYGAGIEITMPPGSHTYWKVPGDAGVPPVFSFAGSQNVAATRVLYPAPRRITEEGLEAFGYLDRVTFPVVVTPADPAKPALLKADVSYAICNRICIPAHGSASIALPLSKSGSDAAALDAAFAAVPAPTSPAEAAALSLVRDAGAAKPSWNLTWRGAAPVDDIFADAPQGFYFATRRTGPATWALVAEESPASGAADPVTVALTLARAAHPLVVEEKLDLRAATR